MPVTPRRTIMMNHQSEDSEMEAAFAKLTIAGVPKAIIEICHSPTIKHDGSEYRAKDKIPPDAWKHIEKHREYDNSPHNSGSSYFLSTISDTHLGKMIKETSLCPQEFKVDDRRRNGRGAGKMIYRFREYDQIIGRHGEKQSPCRWLVVAAKSNGWIKTAYPVPRPFLPSRP